ncbi:MAG TPA: TIM barrel protein [Devosia sp.]|nr:TIM barrel protein [Devosia sp.]
MKLRVGLNPYGLTYHLGLQGRGTPRANPRPAGLEGFLALCSELGAETVELWEGWLTPMSAPELAALRARLGGRMPVVSSGLERGDLVRLFELAEALEAPLLRFALTGVLCGDRATSDPPWPERVRGVREKLARAAEMAERAGRTVVIENHQDFTSDELVGLCEQFGPAVRIVYDTGNSFPVGEAPLDFTRAIAPYVRYVHLKDYRVQRTDEGIRLVRCAIGDGAVPFAGLLDCLAAHHAELPAVLEPGALEARHVRFFTEGWWQGYPPREARALVRCLAATLPQALAAHEDYRTPWERGEDHALEAYELDMIRRSAANMRALGIMKEGSGGAGSQG